MDRVRVRVMDTSPPCFFFLASSLNKRHRISLLGLIDLRGLIGVVYTVACERVVTVWLLDSRYSDSMASISFRSVGT
jgi:hypothetical protein